MFKVTINRKLVLSPTAAKNWQMQARLILWLASVKWLASEALDEVAKDVTAESVAEIATGATELGAAHVLHTAADAAKEED